MCTAIDTTQGGECGSLAEVRLGDWQNLDDLEPGDLQARLLDNLDLLVSASDPSTEDSALEEMPEALTILWFLNWLEFEVAQGSLVGYLFNSHGRHAGKAADALRSVGAVRSAQLLDRAAEVARAHRAEWAERHAALDALPLHSVVTPYVDLAGVDEISRLADEFEDAVHLENYGERLDNFVASGLRAVQEWATKP